MPPSASCTAVSRLLSTTWQSASRSSSCAAHTVTKSRVGSRAYVGRSTAGTPGAPFSSARSAGARTRTEPADASRHAILERVSCLSLDEAQSRQLSQSLHSGASTWSRRARAYSPGCQRSSSVARFEKRSSTAAPPPAPPPTPTTAPTTVVAAAALPVPAVGMAGSSRAHALCIAHRSAAAPPSGAARNRERSVALRRRASMSAHAESMSAK